MDDTSNSAVSAPIEAPSAPAPDASAIAVLPAATPGSFGLSPSRIGEIASELAVQKGGASPATVAEPGYSEPSRAFQTRTPAPSGRLGLAPDQINRIAADLAMKKAGVAGLAEEAATSFPSAFFEKNPGDYYGFIHEMRGQVTRAIGEENAVELLFAYADLYQDELIEYFGEQWLATIAPHVNPQDLAALPNDLADFVPRLRAEIWEELSWMGPSEQLWRLRQLKNDVEKAEREYQQERDGRAMALSNYQQQQLQSIEKMAADFETEMRASIAGFAPHGADNQQANMDAQRVIYAQALGTMQIGFSKMSMEFLEDVELAGIAKLSGNAALADAHASAACAKQDKWEDTFRRILALYRDHHEALITAAENWRKQEAREREIAEAEAALRAPPVPASSDNARTPGSFRFSPEKINQIIANSKRLANAQRQ